MQEVIGIVVCTVVKNDENWSVFIDVKGTEDEDKKYLCKSIAAEALTNKVAQESSEGMERTLDLIQSNAMKFTKVT